jgi:metal-responsive CopG/Arc/MetJ family transcriptional regulator
MKTAVKIDKSLCQRAERAAAEAGYSSREEFIEHAIEKELAHYEDSESHSPKNPGKKTKDDMLRKLKGLGYIE